MKTYICEICGDAYLGEAKPKNCPFCGARQAFIKEGKKANPIVSQKIDISEKSIKNLKETYGLEVKASAIYTCMAGKTNTYEVKAMFKRLAKVELEHAVITTKLLGAPAPVVGAEECGSEDIANFKRTIELEEHASSLYARFARESEEENIKILFTALTQAESDHISLIKNYL
jgi:rubrerythrin